jgi:hypothetical protein
MGLALALVSIAGTHGSLPAEEGPSIADPTSGRAVQVFDIRDFGGTPQNGGNIQRVLDLISEAYPAGGVVHIPKGDWKQSATLRIKGGRVILQGEGWDSRVIGKDRNAHVFEIVPNPSLLSHAYDITFRDLMIKGNWGGTAGSGNGIHWAADSLDRAPGLHMDHVTVIECGNDGLHLEHVDFPVLIDCYFNTNGRDGAHLDNVAQSSMLGFYANTNRRWGLSCEGGGGHFVQANGIEENQTAGALGDGQMRFLNTGGVVIRSQFEAFTQDNARAGLVLDGARGVVVEGCGFTSGTGAGTVGIVARNTCRSVLVGPNTFNGCAVGVDVSDPSNAGVVVLPQDDQGRNGQIVRYPTGAGADGWQGLIALVQNAGPGGAMKVPGIRLPFVRLPFPPAAAENEGTIVYDRAAPRGQRVKVSDGSGWAAPGTPSEFTTATRPTTGIPKGTVIWVTDAPAQQNLQAWDGTVWRYIPLH